MMQEPRSSDVINAVQHDTQANLFGIFETAMDPIISIDERQRIILYNPAAQATFGWSKEVVLGQDLGILIPARFRQAHADHVRNFGATGVTSRRMEWQRSLVALRATGEEFQIEASISQYQTQEGKIFTVILRDVGERFKETDSTARREMRLRGILESAMDAIITIDEQHNIVLFNLAAEQMFQCPRTEALGAPLSWFIPERFRNDHDGHIKKFGATGTTSRRMGARHTLTGLRRNGDEFPIDAAISQISDGNVKFYTVIVRDVTVIVRTEEALRQSKEDLRLLAATGISVREQEKSRIARELHDELAQALTALTMDVRWVRERSVQTDVPVIEKLGAMENLLSNTVAATRRIAANLRPLMLDDLGLEAATEWLVGEFTKHSGISCDLRFGDPARQINDPHATAIFRILQESLTNVARHAKAAHVTARIDIEDGCVALVIRDDGVGFALTDLRKPQSFGLIGLRERTYLLQGDVRIDSAPGEGTTISVRLPLTNQDSQA